MARAAYNNPDYQRRRTEAIAAEPFCHNDWCNHPDAGTTQNPYTADHRPPLARLQPGQPYTLVVLCRACNGSLGADWQP